HPSLKPVRPSAPFYYRSGRNPSPQPDIIGSVMEQRDMHSRVENALDKVRPALRADGGDARVVACDEENGSVSIQMLGACKGCPLSQLDFVYAIESLIRREVPEVREIAAV
ncbi:MAG: NifU family protein, partial [Actinomycetota bacterium]|nr:NifU family protein [Actinomycetota bacterium]